MDYLPLTRGRKRSPSLCMWIFLKYEHVPLGEQIVRTHGTGSAIIIWQFQESAMHKIQFIGHY